jgi:hypothetical protein
VNDPEPPHLVAVVPAGADANTHVLYYRDGTVVGYRPAEDRVLWVRRLPADAGRDAAGRDAAAPAESPRGAAPRPGAPARPGILRLGERRRDEDTPPPGGGRRAEDTGMRLP